MAVSPARSAAVGAAALALAACGSGAPAGVPLACTEGPEVVLRALERSPERPRLPDGTPLSRCVAAARGHADLQTVGRVLTTAAERLEARADEDPAAARRLGALVGAARRGAARTAGLQAELVRRLERSAALDGARPEVRRALERGLAAGRARG